MCVGRGLTHRQKRQLYDSPSIRTVAVGEGRGVKREGRVHHLRLLNCPVYRLDVPTTFYRTSVLPDQVNGRQILTRLSK